MPFFLDSNTILCFTTNLLHFYFFFINFAHIAEIVKQIHFGPTQTKRQWQQARTYILPIEV